jgi:hypothetical protein
MIGAGPRNQSSVVKLALYSPSGGFTSKQTISSSDYEYQTLRDAVWVSSRIELSRRRDNLTWGHHREVASWEPEEQDIARLRRSKFADLI